MDIQIKGEDPLKYKKIQMNCDHRLDDDKMKFPQSLASFHSGFNLLINGSSGSGKTNLLINLLRSRNDKQNGIRRSFKKIFDNVIVISPSLKTLKDDVFKGLKHKYSTFDEETLEIINDVLNDAEEDTDDEDNDEPKKTLLIMDDCGSMLKGGMKEKMFNHLVKNRRHRHLSIICITQKFKDASTTHRSNLTHFIFFKPRNELEMTAIYDEMIGQPRKYMHDIMNSLFNKRFNNVMIDYTQHHGQGGFQYYSNFRPIDFIKK
jgi:DNA replication protein DnaC